MDPIKNGDIPACYVIVYQRVSSSISTGDISRGWGGLFAFGGVLLAPWL